MSEQGMYRNTDPDTSRIAARKLLPRIGTILFEVLQTHHAHYPVGLTDLELHYIGRPGSRDNSSLRKRRNELEKSGYIVRIGEKTFEKELRGVYTLSQEGVDLCNKLGFQGEKDVS